MFPAMVSVAAIAASLSFSTPVEPPSEVVVIAPPAITGGLDTDAELTFDMGLYSGPVEQMHYRVRQTSPSATLIDWTVASATPGTVTPVDGSSLILDVRINGASGLIVSSSPHGPFTSGGDVLIGAWVVHSSTDYNPTPAGHPFNYTLLAPNPAENLYDPNKGYGFNGNLAATSTTNFSVASRGDVRLNGRVSGNVTPAQTAFRIDVPEPGTYILYTGMGAASVVTPNTVVLNGAVSSAALLATLNKDALSTTSAQVMDATGAVMTIAEWGAASIYGGNGLEVEVTGTSILVARSGTTGAPVWCCFCVVKKGS